MPTSKKKQLRKNHNKLECFLGQIYKRLEHRIGVYILNGTERKKKASSEGSGLLHYGLPGRLNFNRYCQPACADLRWAGLPLRACYGKES
jgi:hypothetical protein